MFEIFENIMLNMCIYTYPNVSLTRVFCNKLAHRLISKIILTFFPVEIYQLINRMLKIKKEKEKRFFRFPQKLTVSTDVYLDINF